MNFKDKKLFLLHQLVEETEPIGLESLLGKLGKEFAERSVRRWLSEMINEGIVEKQGRKRGTKYQAVKSRRQKSIQTSSCFGSESALIIEQVRRPLYERLPKTYAEEWFDSYQPNVTFYLQSSFREQLLKAGKRSQNEDPAGTYAFQIFNRLLIDLSYNSSRLEGNTYSLLDTERLILEGTSAEGKLDGEKVMILNHKEAIRYLVDSASRLEVNSQTICTLHYLLADGLLEARYSGKVRDHGVRISGSTYIPFDDSRQLQLQMERITEKAAWIHDPYEQSLFLLIHISYLQAFSDVNKRTARLSANIPFIIKNLVPLSFNDIERDDYTSAMIAIYELQDVRPMIDLYIFSYLRTCARYDATIKSIGFDEVRVRYRSQRRTLIRYIILNKLVGKEMKDYMTSQTKALIAEKDQASFIEDALEDLQEMDQSRLAGLGITPDQLEIWLKKYRT